MEMEVDGQRMSADRFIEKFVHELDAGGNCRAPWCSSTSDNGLDHVNFEKSGLKVVWERGLPEVEVPGLGVTVPQEAEPVKPIKMGPGRIHWEGMDFRFKDAFLHASPPKGYESLNQPGAPYPPDTDEEHELAAGAFLESDLYHATGGKEDQVVLALPIRRLPETNAVGYVFGDEYRGSKLVEWCMQFIKKQADYGNSANDLGMEGQYSEIHRKLGKLRRAMWEGHPLVNEGLEEVLMDLVGHCFLAMMFNDNPGIVRYKKGRAQ